VDCPRTFSEPSGFEYAVCSAELGDRCAFTVNSTLRVPLDIALLDAVTSEWWQQELYRHLGQVAVKGT
jgi:hypothetical protein